MPFTLTPEFWRGEGNRRLSPAALRLYLYMASHDMATPFGSIRQPAISLAREIGAGEAEVAELCGAGLLRTDASMVWLPSYLGAQKGINPNIAVKMANLMKGIPECPLLVEAAEAVVVYLVKKGSAHIRAFAKACRGLSLLHDICAKYWNMDSGQGAGQGGGQAGAQGAGTCGMPGKKPPVFTCKTPRKNTGKNAAKNACETVHKTLPETVSETVPETVPFNTCININKRTTTTKGRPHKPDWQGLAASFHSVSANRNGGNGTGHNRHNNHNNHNNNGSLAPAAYGAAGASPATMPRFDSPELDEGFSGFVDFYSRHVPDPDAVFDCGYPEFCNTPSPDFACNSGAEFYGHSPDSPCAASPDSACNGNGQNPACPDSSEAGGEGQEDPYAFVDMPIYERPELSGRQIGVFRCRDGGEFALHESDLQLASGEFASYGLDVKKEVRGLLRFNRRCPYKKKWPVNDFNAIMFYLGNSIAKKAGEKAERDRAREERRAREAERKARKKREWIELCEMYGVDPDYDKKIDLSQYCEGMTDEEMRFLRVKRRVAA